MLERKGRNPSVMPNMNTSSIHNFLVSTVEKNILAHQHTGPSPRSSSSTFSLKERAVWKITALRTQAYKELGSCTSLQHCLAIRVSLKSLKLRNSIPLHYSAIPKIPRNSMNPSDPFLLTPPKLSNQGVQLRT